MTELNENLLNITTNSWSKQVYVQGFYFEPITFKEAVNMFEHMKIAESIYEGVLETYYTKLIGQTRTVLSTAVK